MGKLLDGLRGNRSEAQGTALLPRDLEREYSASLRATLAEQARDGDRNGLYGTTIVAFVYNHERIEGGTLTPEQTRAVFETRDTLGAQTEAAGDVISAANHTRMFDLMLETADAPPDPALARSLHAALMAGSPGAGRWKLAPNAVGRISTCPPGLVGEAMSRLFAEYGRHEPTLGNIARLHMRFEEIHPFPDGNGRVGRALVFRECLRAGMAPLIVEADRRADYYRELERAQAGRDPEGLVSLFREMQASYLARAVPLLPDRGLAARLAPYAPGIPGPFSLERGAGFTDDGSGNPAMEGLRRSWDQAFERHRGGAAGDARRQRKMGR